MARAIYLHVSSSTLGRRINKMKRLPFPYAIAAELWLFGPPARKQTLPHLLCLIITITSGAIPYLFLEDRIGRLLSILAAIPIAVFAGYAAYWITAQLMPLLHWLVSKGIVAAPDEQRFREKIMWTACWTEKKNEK
jgi:hypothetical protein